MFRFIQRIHDFFSRLFGFQSNGAVQNDRVDLNINLIPFTPLLQLSNIPLLGDMDYNAVMNGTMGDDAIVLSSDPMLSIRADVRDMDEVLEEEPPMVQAQAPNLAYQFFAEQARRDRVVDFVARHVANLHLDRPLDFDPIGGRDELYHPGVPGARNGFRLR